MTKRSNYVEPNRTLEQAVKQAVPQVWNEICYDADQLEGGCDLEGAIELCLDADRPVTSGFMTKDEYDAMLNHDPKVVEKWAREVLKRHF